MRKHGVIVSDNLKQYGGEQGLIVNGINVHFELIYKNILSFTQRAISKNQLEILKINWLSHQMLYQNIDNNPMPVLQRQYVQSNIHYLLVLRENYTPEEDTM